MIRLKARKRGITRPGHPWIFKGQILQPGPSIKSGNIISILNAEGKFFGRGYYNPRSDIAIRILTFKDEAIGAAFFEDRIRTALGKREALSSKTNAYRAVFSEADGLPGLIIDIYSNTAVFQILTLGMEKFKTIVAEGIKEIINPEYIYEKSTSPFRKIEGLKDERRWWGDHGKALIEIFEAKARFLVDIESSHKTGFYLDQRNSRMALQGMSKGKTVLDLFCYTGAFSVSACLFGAKKVIGVDIKEEWLKLARKNAMLNDVSERIEFVKKDAFEFLTDAYNSGQTYNIIIIDPPSFIKARHSLASASKGYGKLNLIAMKALVEGGILATFSCSHNMPNEVFSNTLKDAARDAGKTITILKRCHQAEDHPIVRAIPETEYLKGYFLKINAIYR